MCVDIDVFFLAASNDIFILCFVALPIESSFLLCFATVPYFAMLFFLTDSGFWVLLRSLINIDFNFREHLLFIRVFLSITMASVDELEVGGSGEGVVVGVGGSNIRSGGGDVVHSPRCVMCAHISATGTAIHNRKNCVRKHTPKNDGVSDFNGR